MSSIFSTRTRKAIAAAALVTTASLSVAACGSSDDTSNASSSTKASAPKPVATIDSLTGNNTQVTLDQGFVDALTQLKLTPGTVGAASLGCVFRIFLFMGGDLCVVRL